MFSTKTSKIQIILFQLLNYIYGKKWNILNENKIYLIGNNGWSNKGLLLTLIPPSFLVPRIIQDTFGR